MGGALLREDTGQGATMAVAPHDIITKSGRIVTPNRHGRFRIIMYAVILHVMQVDYKTVIQRDEKNGNRTYYTKCWSLIIMNLSFNKFTPPCYLLQYVQAIERDDSYISLSYAPHNVNS